MNLDNFKYDIVNTKWKNIVDTAPVDEYILLAAITMTEVMFVGVGKIRHKYDHRAIGSNDVEWKEIVIKDQFKDKMHLNWGISKWWTLPSAPIKIKLML